MVKLTLCSTLERAETQAFIVCGHVKEGTCVTRRPITGLIHDHKTNLLLSLLLSTPCAHLVAHYDLPSVSSIRDYMIIP
jgi:hypothetical protein